MSTTGRVIGRDPPRQPDLGGDATPDPFGRHALRELLGTLRGGERRRLPGLRRSNRGLQLLQQPDPVDPHRIIDALIQPAQRGDQPRQRGITGRLPADRTYVLF